MRNTGLTIAALMLFGPLNAALANPISEIGDAGDLIPTAQNVGPGIDSISGILGTNDVDLFGINLSGGLFTASTVGGSFADTQLWLFDSAGFGIVANDDTATQQSLISANLAAGFYFLGISVWNVDPFSADGAIFPDFQFCCNHPISGPTGPGGGSALSSWSVLGGGNQSGSYTITLNKQTVPEPGALLLFGMGILGMGLAGRRKKV